jgi:NCS1 family nucleobase:cation symporter-1
MSDPNGYIFTWLIAYSSLLGPIGGIMIADYYFIRKKELVVEELYQHTGRYNFTNGFNSKAIISLMLGILPNVPGFLLQVKLVSENQFPGWISNLYNYAWFVGFFVSGILYMLFMRSTKTGISTIKSSSYVAID